MQSNVHNPLFTSTDEATLTDERRGREAPPRGWTGALSKGAARRPRLGAMSPTLPPEPPADLPSTLGELRASGWESTPVHEELRANAAARIAAGLGLVDGVLGFDDTVLPQLEN